MAERVTPLPIAVPDDTYAKLSACVHCGLCLPACPTYVATADEADSPRGRILFMKGVVDGRLEPSATVLAHLERCLVCRACEVACPSGVQYGELIEELRPRIAAAARGRPVESRALRFLLRHVLPYAGRVRLSILPLKAARRLGLGGLVTRVTALLPEAVREMTALLPDGPLLVRSLPAYVPAVEPRRGSVLLLLGCVGAVVSQEVNRAAVKVLAANGFDVFTLAIGSEPCCGAMAAHANEPELAVTQARALVELLSGRREDYFVSPIAGCGAQLKHLDGVLGASARYQSLARAAVRKVRDVNELLAEVGLRPPTRAGAGTTARRVTYHDPCHLLNVQKISAAPRALLQQVPGLELVPLLESDLCCGAAGTYNLQQPELAGTLGERKVENLRRTGCGECVTANVGCQLHMQRKLRERGESMRVRHVVEVLAEGYV
jgi:glycolate oxidase iron-sulfur subunit